MVSVQTVGEFLSLLHKCDFHSHFENIILENVYWCFLFFISLQCFHFDWLFLFFPFQCSEPSSISTVSSTNTSGSGASSCGSDGVDVFEISGRSPAMTSTPKQKTRLHEDPCSSEEAPAVNVNVKFHNSMLCSYYIFITKLTLKSTDYVLATGGLVVAWVLLKYINIFK